MNSFSRSKLLALHLATLAAAAAALAAVLVGQTTVAAFLTATAILTLGLASLVAYRALVWIGRATAICQAAAGGDFDRRLTRLPVGGDMRDLAIAVNGLIDVTDAFLREAAASMQHVSVNQYWRRILATGLAGQYRRQAEIINVASEAIQHKVMGLRQCAREFEDGVKHVVETVASAATQLQANTESMSASAVVASSRTAEIAASSQQASANVQMVSSAAEQLTASVGEISQHISRSATTAEKGVDEARRARETVGKLSDAADRIGDAIRLISNIASQTNLLALNATIEAARAGESGKGFAVVATEVKHLASQTATATDEITAHITEIRATAEDVRRAIEGVDGTIHEMHDNAAAIQETVTQQRIATDEIARNMQEAANGTVSITTSLRDVSDAADVTGEASRQTMSAASELAREAEHLRGRVESFLVAVRSAA